MWQTIEENVGECGIISDKEKLFIILIHYNPRKPLLRITVHF